MFDLPTKRSRAHMAAAKRQHGDHGFPPLSELLPPPPPVTTAADPDPDTDTDPVTSTVVVVVPPPSTTAQLPPPVTTQTQAPPPPPPTASATPSTSQVAPPPPPATTASPSPSTPAAVNTPSTTLTTPSPSVPAPNPNTSATPAPPATSLTTSATVTRSKGAATAPAPNDGGATTSVHVNTVTAALAGHGASTSAVLPTTTVAPSSGASKGELAGGIAAAVVACAGILFAVVWALRKCRGRHDDFDPDSFKRKSTALPDEPSAWQPRPNGDVGGPRPPTMLERTAAAPSVVPGYAPAFAPNYGPSYAPEMAQGYAPAFAPHAGQAPWTPHGAAPDFAWAQQQQQAAHMSGYSTASFSPGDVVFSSPQSPPATAMAAQPVFFVPGSPARGFGGMDARGAPVIGESVPSTPTQDAPPALARAPSMARQSRDTAAHYVDLDRSSVTPFQARQYSELHARLEQIPPPPPLPHMAAASPFADPVGAASTAHATEEHEYIAPAEDEAALDDASDVQHGIPHADEEDAELAPPAPVYDAPRITSMPPTLPELLPRAFSPVSLGPDDAYNFTLHAGGSTLAAAESFPSTPNPPVTPAEDAFAAQQQARSAPAPAVRPETVYDMEDAYDGI